MVYSIRKTARAVLLTPQHDVLLMRMAFPWQTEDIWILPGGGIEEGEDGRSAVTREVFEETGATDIDILGEVWRHELLIEATNMCLKQRFFLVHTERFDPIPTDLTEPEMDWVQEYRWWNVNSLATTNITVEPAHIAREIQALISQGLPTTPIDIDS